MWRKTSPYTVYLKYINNIIWSSFLSTNGGTYKNSALYIHNTHLEKLTPSPDKPCMSRVPSLPPKNRVTHVTHDFAPWFLPRLVPTNPVAILHHLAIRDLRSPKKHEFSTTSLSTSDGSVKIMISGENQLPFWKKMENFPLDTTWQKRSNQWLGSNRNDTATVTSNNNDDEDHKNIDNGTPKQL